MTTTDPIKTRALQRVASAAGQVSAAEKTRATSITERDDAAVLAQSQGASYEDLQRASGLTRVGVYKMLKRGKGKA